MSIKQGLIKLTLERVITKVGKSPEDIEWGWRFRQSPYTRQEWETFDIPVACGIACVYDAYITECCNVEEWKGILKDKAMQELQKTMVNIQQQMKALEETD